jgi:UDP-N-acetylglucosamine 2-epimerase (non-hydrolysing)
MAPVVRALRAEAPAVDVRVALTGQHTTLVDQVLEAFALEPEYDVGTPDYDLGIMKEGQSLYDVLHAALDGLRAVVAEFGPDTILVQGDTATVFAASLVGFLERVRVGHVEAGLRSGDKWAPFPEEIFRRLTDVIADDYFVPTGHAAANLAREGVSADRIHVTGNTVVDAVLMAAERPHEPREPALRGVLADPAARLVLLTAHRRESFGAPLRGVFDAVRRLVERTPDIHVVYPVHPNPAVREAANERLSDHPRIHLVEPLGYLDMIAAMKGAALVLTDSGGIQEEAPTLGAPVLVLRAVTERPEGSVPGLQEVVGLDPDRILERGLTMLAAGARGPRANPYGDGRAGERIADIVVSGLTGRKRRTRDWGASAQAPR